LLFLLPSQGGPYLARRIAVGNAKTLFISFAMQTLQLPTTVSAKAAEEPQQRLYSWLPAAFVQHLERSDDPPMAKFCTVPSFPFETRRNARLIHVFVAVFLFLLVSSSVGVSFVSA
jgi:hypothetical protein